MVGYRLHIVLLICVAPLAGSFSQTPAGVGLGEDAILRYDSLQHSTAQYYLTLHHDYDSVAGITSVARQRIQEKIDSLESVGQSPALLSIKLDSITHLQSSKLDSIRGLFGAAQSRAQAKIAELDLPPVLASEAGALSSRIGDVALPSERLGIDPGVISIPSDVPGLENPIPALQLPTAPGVELPALESSLSAPSVPEIPATNLSTGDIGDLADPLAHVQQQVAGVIPADAESAAAMIEQKATSIPEAAAVTQQLDEAAALDPLPATPEDPEAMKEELIEDGKKMAVNHFAGKEAQLQQAMDKLAVYKKKYHSIESVANLPRKAPNEMRDKTFVERVVPGFALQVGRNDHWLLDINLYMGYRFTGRITAGTGWNQRIAYSADANAFSSGTVIYGPRAYGEYSIGKGFTGRLEVEYMNTYVPAPFASNPDNPNSREWVFGTMAGMKKAYTITRRLKGTVLLMYNLYDPHHRSPYRNRLNGRFGVEWRIINNHNNSNKAYSARSVSLHTNNEFHN